MANKYYRGFEKVFKLQKNLGENIGKNINTIVGILPEKKFKSKIRSNSIFKSLIK